MVEKEKIPAVYLCQVGPTVSCGACCGLYNVGDPGRNALEAMLAQRTEAFRQIPQTVDDIDNFQRRIQGWTPPDRPFPQFHHCAFLGMIGDEKEGWRVGCLLHPAAAANDGTDWRGLSYYGGFACRTYFCPSNRLLPPHYQRILRQAFSHWYLYGLIVTERRLLSFFFRTVENRLGREIGPGDFQADSVAAGLLVDFARLKLDWSYRRKGAPGPCNYFFENGQYPRPPVTRTAPDIPQSRYETIFQELESSFATKAELMAAEVVLDRLVADLVGAIRTVEGK